MSESGAKKLDPNDPSLSWCIRAQLQRETAPGEAYFAPGPEALEQEHTLAVLSGGPSADERAMALKDLADTERRIHESGTLSPKRGSAEGVFSRDK